MSWLEQLQSAPKEKKVRIIWISVIVVLILLVGFWLLIGNYHNGATADNSLFNTIGNSFKQFSKQKFTQ